ncbi:MAG: acylneuraminate cytidylyltransferase family protein [Bacteroidota bacterium]
MTNRKNIVAIIPARGGSKSIPRKNIRLLGGIPLIAYSIAAGLQSQLLDRVIVSTDDEEIARVAMEWGGEVPFLRPAALAGDEVTDWPVFEHVVRWLEEEDDYPVDTVVQLRPTSPFRPPTIVDEAIRQLYAGEADSLRGVTPSGQNPYKMWHMEGELMQPIMDTPFTEPYNMPRQKLPTTFWQTGHIEAIHRDTLLQQRSMTGHHIMPFEIPPGYAVDLDTLWQWQYAEYLLEHGNLELIHPTWMGEEIF